MHNALQILKPSFGVAMIVLLSGVSNAFAANPSNGLRIEIMKAYNFVVDSNVESPSSYGPRSAYLGAQFCNDGVSAISNVTAYIGNFTNNTPGVYPARSHLALTGTFSLTHEGGSAGLSDAVRYLGTIEPGECVQVYWLVSYPLKDDLGNAVWGPSVKPDDDLFLFYDMWATATRAGTNIAADQRQTVYMRNQITASANKIVPNTANKVPDEYKDLLQIYAPTWTNTTLSGAPGSTIQAEGYWYDLGLVGEGFDNDGDLVPDRNAWLQPVGDPALFDAGCFRLVRTYAFVVVKLKSGGEIVYTGENQLYFENIPPNNGAVGFVGYEIAVLQGDCGSILIPYQEVASGRDNEKYNADFGATPGGALTSTDTAMDISKSVDRTIAAEGDTLEYTLTFSNFGSLPVGTPSLNLPLVLHDTIPEGAVYVAGSADTTNNVLPQGISGYDVVYSTNNGINWVSVEPSPATNVTDIQWWLREAMPTGTAGNVKFQVTVDNPFTNAPPRIVNTGALTVGGGVPFAEDDAITLISGSNSLVGTTFFDTGVGGGILGNVIQDGTEGPVTNVSVFLYYDNDLSTNVTSGDTLLYTFLTTASGAYTFTNLPDGDYVVAVNRNDPAIPSGFTPTVFIQQPVSLDAAKLIASPVIATQNFGFAEVLGLEKTAPAEVSEGSLITYTINVANRYDGSGTGDPLPINYTLYAASEVASLSAGWNNTTNAYDGPPNGLFASVDYQGGPSTKTLALGGYNVAPQIFTITNVSVAVPFTRSGAFSVNDTIAILIRTSVNAAVSAVFTQIYNELSLPVSGTLEVDITSSITNWSWDFFNAANSNFFVQLESERGSGASKGTFSADQAVVTIQTDGENEVSCLRTINPAPLYDYYDTNRLAYVSSSLTPFSVTSDGSPPNEGVIFWSNVGPVFPGGTSSVSVTFRVLEPAGNAAQIITNTAAIINPELGCGRAANNATSTVATTIRPAGSIGDFVWRDLNNDGVQDGGNEAGLAGVSVRLTPPAGVDLGNGPGAAITNVTDETGFYLFTSLPSNGVYTVTVLTNTLPGGIGVNTYDRDDGTVSPDNEVLTNLNVTAVDGSDNALDVDFGYGGLQSEISGSIWNDSNCDGDNSPDLYESFLDSITVSLISNGTTIATTVTTNGAYQFTGAFAGSFTVQVDTNSGSLATSAWRPAFDSDGTNTPHEATVTLVSGGSAVGNFGYCETGPYSIGDEIFYDWDGNGTRDAIDEGVPNVTVRLYRDFHTNGVVDISTDPIVRTDVTDVTGAYLFEDLPAGNYVVTVDVYSPGFPVRYDVTADPQGDLDSIAGVTITNANRLDIDFGYRPFDFGVIGDTVWRDLAPDGVQSGFQETGLTNVTVRLEGDFNGDGTYSLLTTASTGPGGFYQFTRLANGPYRVFVDRINPGIPLDAFGEPWFRTTEDYLYVTVSNSSTFLAADFGFAPLGGIGDTIYWDVNKNGTPDFNEGGVSNVTVNLYVDTDQNGLLSAPDVLLDTKVTDANGNYLFSGLLPTSYVVVVVTTGVLDGAILSADPDADGLPCSDPAATGCDNQTGLNLLAGQILSGADFGYNPPTGVIGDAVFIDFNNNGIYEPEESGIPFVEVSLYTNGVLLETIETDSDGFYIFYELPEGDYYVVVNTNDTDWPAGLLQSADPDGTFDSVATNIVIADNQVVSIGGVACTNCDLSVDFAYRFASTNVLSGTIGVDNFSNQDGLMGTNTSGVGLGEVPFVGLTVYAYLWNDDGDEVLEAGETELVNSTDTDANGDYSFDDLPLGDGDDLYLISMTAPLNGLTLTTTTNATPATILVNNTNFQGFTLSAFQALAVTSLIENLDFAYVSAQELDFGDAPASYDTSFPLGARHLVPLVPTLYLGSGVDTESNGQPSAGADGDDIADTDDEDGVILTNKWRNGAGGGSVQVTIGAGSGYLVAYGDFNQSGNFVGNGNLFISQVVSNTGGAASNGVYDFTFNVPANSLSSTGSVHIYTRFRLFPSQPLFPAFAYSGEAANGEVEDYLFSFHVIRGSVLADLDDNTNVTAGVDGPVPGAAIALYDASGSNLIARTVTATDGSYYFNGLLDGDYLVQLTTPSGSSAIFDVDGSGNGLTNIAVTISSNSVTGRDFLIDTNGNFAGISGTVYEDNGFGVAGDGLFNGTDESLPAVPVTLYRDLDLNALVSSEELVGVISTDETGGYSFTNLPDGDFIVIASTPSGATNVLDADGVTNGASLIQVTLSGVDVTGQDFLFDGSSFIAAIGDRVWFDFNGNGLQDENEDRLLPGIPVSLVSTAGFNVATTTTGTNGLYRFEKIPLGTYFIRFDLSSINATGNLKLATAKAGQNDALDSDGVSGSLGGFVETTNFTLAANSTNLNFDLGLAYITIKTRASVAQVFGEWADNQARVVWETDSEWGTAGFHIYRVDAETGREERLNETLIPSVMDSSGGVYLWVDEQAKSGASGRYRIEEVEVFGDRIDLGIHEVTFQPALTPKAAGRKPAPAIATSSAMQTFNTLLEGPSDCLKVSFRKPGVYAVTLASIAGNMGVDEATLDQWVAQGELALSRGHQSVAYHLDEAGRRIVFHAPAIDNFYTRDNVVMIKRGEAQRMLRRDPGAVNGRDALPVTVRYEEDVYLFDNLATPVDDLFYWNYVIAGHATLGAPAFALDLSGYRGGDAGFVVRLIGMTHNPSHPDHIAEILVNGSVVHVVEFNGQDQVEAAFTVPGELLLDGINQLVLRGTPPVDDSSVFVLDCVSVRFNRAVAPLAETQYLPVETATAISAAAYQQPFVLSVMNPHRPVLIADAPGGLPAKAWRAAHHNERFAVIEQQAIPVLHPVPATCEAWFLDPANRVDYLMVVSRAMTNALQELVDYRSAQGLRVNVATFEDLCDVFAGGLRTPEAVTAFVRFASANWAESPWLLLLAGNGHYDYLSAYSSEPNPLPPLLRFTDRGVAAADGLFGDLNGDGLPDIAVGRLPALDESQLSAMIAKIKAHEAGYGEYWQKNMAVVADFRESEGALGSAADFLADTDAMAAPAGGVYSLNKIYLDDTGLTLGRTKLMQDLQSGVGVMHYTGHGNFRTMGNQGTIFGISDANTIANQRQPVMVALSCMVGRYEAPGLDSLGEVLLRRNQAGAVAVWSPSSMSEHDKAAEIGRVFYQGLADGDWPALGPAIQQTAAAFADDPAALEAIMTYNLLGDPAMKITGLRGSGRKARDFNEWRWGVFDPDALYDASVSGVTGSADDSGTPNLVHYALGTQPGGEVDPDTVNLSLVKQPYGLTIEARQRIQRDDLRYRLRLSENLEHWEYDPADVEVIGVEPNDDGETEKVRFRVNRPHANRVFIGREFIYTP